MHAHQCTHAPGCVRGAQTSSPCTAPAAAQRSTPAPQTWRLQRGRVGGWAAAGRAGGRAAAGELLSARHMSAGLWQLRRHPPSPSPRHHARGLCALHCPTPPTHPHLQEPCAPHVDWPAVPLHPLGTPRCAYTHRLRHPPCASTQCTHPPELYMVLSAVTVLISPGLSSTSAPVPRSARSGSSSAGPSATCTGQQGGAAGGWVSEGPQAAALSSPAGAAHTTHAAAPQRPGGRASLPHSPTHAP